MRLLRRLANNHDGSRSAATRQHYMQSYQAITSLAPAMAQFIEQGPQMLGSLRVSKVGHTRTMTDIGNRAVEDLAVRAIRLAQQMPRIRFATTGDMQGIDMHSGYDHNLLLENN